MQQLLEFCKQLFLRHPVAWTKLDTVINAFAGQFYLDFLSFLKMYNNVLAVTWSGMNQEPCKLYVSKEKEEYQDRTPFYDMTRFQLILPVDSHNLTKNQTGHRMHVAGPQICQINCWNNSFQNMYGMNRHQLTVWPGKSILCSKTPHFRLFWWTRIWVT